MICHWNILARKHDVAEQGRIDGNNTAFIAGPRTQFSEAQWRHARGRGVHVEPHHIGSFAADGFCTLGSGKRATGPGIISEIETMGCLRCACNFGGYLLASTETRIDKSFSPQSVSYTHLRAHETGRNLVCRLLLEK